MTRSPLFGLGLAAMGALVLTPDALFMRLSGMAGLQMLGWRGICLGTIFLTIWAATSRRRRGDLTRLASPAGVVLVAAQFSNALFFPVGIAAAPVAVMLLAVATAPVWSALLSRLVLGETTARSTWVTIMAVLAGIGWAVSGEGELGLNLAALTGAACGLAVALSLATNFVTLRRAPDIPILLAIGLGALLSGTTGWLVTGPAAMTEGTVWAILVTGLVILPVSFFSLSLASRHTAAANVSLFLLLETVLGPLWVWLGTGEAPTQRMLTGGAVVVASLAAYLAHQRALARRGRFGRKVPADRMRS
ncbi:DMT family transporter [Allosediminivita pacifica]|uniref:EamA-like transporter family protein n=1 Tax=Allosediminivita pacifica TaxID=1267769 RepID=A0A2T6B2E5_9RHOB|nr:DMT family transporter [Allosediminivita pacifica]PTX50250.1 EamA-like transporter family protein [Allosediminivita pacifica]GGB02632.1 membrane protein [Allosediminivita pacifica]